MAYYYKVRCHDHPLVHGRRSLPHFWGGTTSNIGIAAAPPMRICFFIVIIDEDAATFLKKSYCTYSGVTMPLR